MTTYLAISKTPYYIAFAVFQDQTLYDLGKVKLKEAHELRRLIEWKEQVADLIKKYKPQFLLTHLLDTEYMMKKDIERVVEVRTILKLVSEEEHAIYMEYKTEGWEQKIIGRLTNNRKITFVNEAYDLVGTEYQVFDVEVANAVILAEGVAHKRLQVSR